MSKILINCSNLHGGGSAAVATSFISFLAKSGLSHRYSLLISSYVYKNLQSLNIELKTFDSCMVLNVFGIWSIFKRTDLIFSNYDIVFTIFGPIYSVRVFKEKHIYGFAQPWIIYPNNLISISMSYFFRTITRWKYLIQAIFFRRANLLIVELNHVKSRLSKNLLLKKSRIEIVHSEVDEIFYTRNSWVECYLPQQNDGYTKIGIISKNYPHKNLIILPLVREILLKKYSMLVDFYLTLSKDEWDNADPSIKESTINCGTLLLSQCPSFYEKMDGVIFPSLLECFSAVPIEAMVMQKPLFASNLPFIRDCCGDFCEYFDPLDPQDVALSIADYFKSIDELHKQEKITNAFNYAVGTFPRGMRGKRYIDIIDAMIHSSK